MDPVTYLTTFTSDFGALEWLCFVAQIALLVAGVYLVFLRAEPHPVRRATTRNLGYALLALGARVLGRRTVAQRLLGSLQVDINKNQDLLGWRPPLSVDEALARLSGKAV